MAKRQYAKIEDLETAFEDGIQLVRLMECISGKNVPGRLEKVPKMRIQKVGNVGYALDFSMFLCFCVFILLCLYFFFLLLLFFFFNAFFFFRKFLVKTENIKLVAIGAEGIDFICYFIQFILFF